MRRIDIEKNYKSFFLVLLFYSTQIVHFMQKFG